MSEYILEMNHITKEFSGVKALDDVNLKVRPGEIMAICGENGAGNRTGNRTARTADRRKARDNRSGGRRTSRGNQS